jgi:hypothetical protein
MRKESGSIKTEVYIKSHRFQRPRVRFFFVDTSTCLNLGQLFHYNFKNL